MYPSLMRSSPAGLLADFDMLQRHIESLLAPSGSSSSIRAVERGSFPAINVGITPDAVEVYAFAPGVDPSSLDVTVDKGLLAIAGARRPDVAEEAEPRTVYARERAVGAFRRAVSLPEDADPDKVDASYRDGILRVRLEKRAASRPRRIDVQPTQSQSQLSQQGATQ